MTEMLSVLVLLTATVREHSVPKYFVTGLSLVVTTVLWWTYYPSIAVYAAIGVAIYLTIQSLLDAHVSISPKHLPLMTLLATAPVTGLPLLTALILILDKQLRGEFIRFIIPILILVSFAAIGQQATQYQLSVFMLFFAAALALRHFWKNNFSSGVLWLILACRYSVFVPEYLREIILWLMIAPLMVIGLKMWSDDSHTGLWLNLQRLGGIVILAATIAFGEFGLWGSLLAWLSLEQCVSLQSEAVKEDNLKIPWPAAAGLFLIPIAPTMLYISSGKSGNALAATSIIGLFISLALWRWIKFAEKQHSDLPLCRNKLIALSFYIVAIVIGCLFNLKAPLTALFINLGVSTVVIILFTVLGVDEMALARKERSTLLLRLGLTKPGTSEGEELKPSGTSISGWGVLANMGRSLTLIISDIESLIHRTLAISVLALVMILMLLGGTNG